MFFTVAGIIFVIVSIISVLYTSVIFLIFRIKLKIAAYSNELYSNTNESVNLRHSTVEAAALAVQNSG